MINELAANTAPATDNHHAASPACHCLDARRNRGRGRLQGPGQGVAAREFRARRPRAGNGAGEPGGPPHRNADLARPSGQRPVPRPMAELPSHMRPERLFQGLILALQRYWADYGCVILQPYDMEVGAGTFHPATTLRALGPNPWNAAYVQPSRRPKDGRYGENPNRLQHYYQFQAMLQPSPDDSP